MGSWDARGVVCLALSAVVVCACGAAPTGQSQGGERSDAGGTPDAGLDASGTQVRLRRPSTSETAAGGDGGNTPLEAGSPEDGSLPEASPEAGEGDTSSDAAVAHDAASDGDAAQDGAASGRDAASQRGPDVQTRFVTFRTSRSIGPQRHPLPFEPKALLCFGVPVPDAAPHPGSAGFVSLSDGVSTAAIADATTSDGSVASRAIDAERGILIRPGTAAPVVRYTVELEASGFELYYESTDGEAYPMGCLALGGRDVQASLVTSAGQTGEIRGLPLRPELIFAITPGVGDDQGGSAADDHPLNSFGVCDATSLSQWWFGMYSADRADGKRAHVVPGKLVGETMFWSSAITEVHDDGFSWEAAGGHDTVAFLAINVAGVPRRVGLFQVESDAQVSTEQTLPDLGFRPQAMGFVSAARTVLTGVGEADTSHAAQTLGMVDGDLNQAALGRFMELGADNADQRWTQGKAVAIPTLDAQHAALGEVVDMTGTAPAVRWSSADGADYRVGYFALGVP